MISIQLPHTSSASISSSEARNNKEQTRQSNILFLRMPDVLKLIQVSRSTLLNWVKQGTFPSPRKLGPRAVAWLACEVDEWCKSRGESA